MSDAWYREPLRLEPFVDESGRRWLFDGTCLDEAASAPSWLDEWPEDLRWVTFKASVQMELLDEFFRLAGIE